MSLCFFMYLGRLVIEKAKMSDAKTIQNQESVLFIARLQIKHTTRATI